MSDDFTGLSDWIPSEEEPVWTGESLERLEDRNLEKGVEKAGPVFVEDYWGPCASCTFCASGSYAAGTDFENKEAALDIVEVLFKANRAEFYANETGVFLQVGSRVIVEAEHGIDLGIVAATGDVVHWKRRSQGIVCQPMGKILRIANDEDLKQLDEIRRTEEKAPFVFREKCSNHNLQMKLTAVEFQFDRSRITFYFISERRVDFRLLVRDLASVYHTRIELRQIGARDVARKVGGLGICGREVCCVAWMTQLHKVNVDCARYQNLALSSSRLAGACGRLKCCILFENQNYLESLEKFPLLGSELITAKGSCIVERVDIFNDRIFLRYHDTGTIDSVDLKEFKTYQVQTQNHTGSLSRTGIPSGKSMDVASQEKTQ